MRIGDLGERWILDYVLFRKEESEEDILAKSDDAFGVHFSGNLIASVDMLVSTTDVPPGMDYYQVGWKAVTMSASDLASKGAKPSYFLISLGLPSDMDDSDFRALWEGIERASSHYGGRIAGGDTNETGELVIDVVALGNAERPVSRKGARVGDLVAVTGVFGRAAAGLEVLVRGIEDPYSHSLTSYTLNPVARVNEGVALARSGALTSSIDSSDGLARSLYELSRASRVGFKVESPPYDKDLARFAERHGLSLFNLVFYGGEEFELVVTLDPERAEDAVRAVRQVGGELYFIGRVTEEGLGISCYWEGKEVHLEDKGWSHFSQRRSVKRY